MTQVDGDVGFVLPVGTVTLVLADIEGSTRRWEQQPDEMVAAIAVFDRLVDEHVRAHDGVRPTERGEGDSFVAAFARASDALASVVDLQRAFAEELPFRVRMAVHTGEVERRNEGDYVGVTVNRCARIRALAHGGQVLVSQTAHDLVADRLPEGVTLEDLGAQRLRDLSRPERVFQLRHPDLASEFPALRSLDQVPNNLPVQLTRFIGRSREIADVTALLADSRLVTLVGSGGAGKTRLALQVAAGVLDDHRDGVWFVELAPLGEDDSVIEAISRASAAGHGRSEAPLDSVAESIGDREVLLVLDNCEHVIGDAADVAAALLARCPGLVVLATSREVLGVAGESVFDVPRLAVPAGSPLPPIEVLTTFEAVELFIDRAVKARPNFTVSNANAAAIVRICQRLDGIPLAIELAAARTRVLTPEQISDGLADRFRLLTGGARTVTPRQQTLRASVDWSYDLLDERERLALARLAVFAGGFELDAAEAVIADDAIDPMAVLDLVTSLTDKSLVTIEAEPGLRGARYRLLETIRHYGLERLRESGSLHEVSRRHRRHCLDVLRDDETSMARVQREMDNIRAALHSADDDGADVELVELVTRAGNAWTLLSEGGEQRRWLDRALAVVADDSPYRPDLLYQLGLTEMTISVDRALSLVRESIPLYRAIGNVSGAAWATAEAGFGVLIAQGIDIARPIFDESRDLAAETADAGLHLYLDWCIAWGLSMGGRCAEGVRAFEAILSKPFALDHHGRWATAMFGYHLGWLGHARRAREVSSHIVEEGRRAGDQVAVMWGAMADNAATTVAADFDAALAAADLMAESGGDYYNQSAMQARWARGIVAVAKGGSAAQLLRDSVTEMASLSPIWALWYDTWTVEALLAEGADNGLTSAVALVGQMREHDLPAWLASALGSEAWARRAAGDAGAAEDLVHEALPIAVAELNMIAVVDGLDLLGVLAAEADSYEEAARLWGAAAAIRDDTGYALRLPHRAAALEGGVARSRGALDADAFDRAWAEGQALDASAAIAYAARGRGERKRPLSGWASLTPMEEQVVDLVAEGLTNRQVGERLFISRHTVDTHLRHVFAKLGVGTRAELAARAGERRRS